MYGYAVSPPVKLSTLLTGWQNDISAYLICSVIAAVFVLYLISISIVKNKGRRWPVLRTLFFLFGLIVVIVAVESGLAYYDDSVFSLHVIQHLLLMNLAPICFALSAPITLFLQALPRTIRSKVIKLLHNKIVAITHHPAVATALTVIIMYGYFLTGIYNYSLNHPLLHDLTHVIFLLAGIMYWWPIVGLDPIKWRLSFAEKLLYLLVLIPLNSFLGIALMSERHTISVHHTISDIHAGGAILWISTEVFDVSAIAIILIQWLNYHQRETERIERRQDELEAIQLEQLQKLSSE
jgi:cytochrome c oxidase assembly factor CtaG